MTYLLDTNVCIRLLNDPPDSIVARRLAIFDPSDIVLCFIVKLELYYGSYRSRKRDRNLEQLSRFFRQLESYDFDDRAAQIAGIVRANLEAKGTPIGSNDLLIAAIALANNLVLVTHNTREFSRVEGLQYEDWET